MTNDSGVRALVDDAPSGRRMEARVSGTLLVRGGWFCLGDERAPDDDASTVELPWGTVVTPSGALRLRDGTDLAPGSIVSGTGGTVTNDQDPEVDADGPWWVPGIAADHVVVMHTVDCTGPDRDVDSTTRWAVGQILGPVLEQMLEASEPREVDVRWIDGDLVATVRVGAERFGVFVVTRGVDEDDVQVRARVASDLQDHFAESTFAWATLRTYDPDLVRPAPATGSTGR